MRIGAFLGSFDPIHNDHLKVISDVLNSKKVDRLLVVPAFHNPWKKHNPAPFGLRCMMIAAATHPYLEMGAYLYPIESYLAKKDRPVYSYMTLNAIRKAYFPDDEFFIVCGEDVANVINKWAKYDEFIAPYWKPLVVKRPEGTCSSTEVRNRVKNKQDISMMVPESVNEIIIENSLYGE